MLPAPCQVRRQGRSGYRHGPCGRGMDGRCPQLTWRAIAARGSVARQPAGLGHGRHAAKLSDLAGMPSRCGRSRPIAWTGSAAQGATPPIPPRRSRGPPRPRALRGSCRGCAGACNRVSRPGGRRSRTRAHRRTWLSGDGCARLAARHSTTPPTAPASPAGACGRHHAEPSPDRSGHRRPPGPAQRLVPQSCSSRASRPQLLR